jgi:uncharacterized cupin superfamily protein
MSDLDPGTVVAALAVDVPLTPPPAAQIIAGAPQTGSLDLDEDLGIGVWEMTPGAMSDIEVDEVFVVIAGDAIVEFIDPALPTIELRAGAVVALTAGMRTIWTVRETLRKIYLV